MVHLVKYVVEFLNHVDEILKKEEEVNLKIDKLKIMNDIIKEFVNRAHIDGKRIIKEYEKRALEEVRKIDDKIKKILKFYKERKKEMIEKIKNEALRVV